VRNRLRSPTRMWLAGSLAGLLTLPALAGAPAIAQGRTSAGCTIVFTTHFAPGFTLSPTSGIEGTGGETGSINCTGTLDGHRVTGPGTFGYDGTFTAITCLFDGRPLSGRYAITVPTEAGPVRFSGTVTDSRIGLIDRVSASAPGAQFTGVAVIVPTQGTCVLSPLTEARIYVIGSFTPQPGAPSLIPARAKKHRHKSS